MSGAFALLALDAYWRDWLDLLLRWLHVIAAIAWIGTSFYFVLLDQSLRPPKNADDAEAGVGGELWEVHGGGFYKVQKYQVAPPKLPDHLAWFKWEAYTTWLSGFGLLVVLFYLDAHANLIDPTVADLSTWEAIAISVGLSQPRGSCTTSSAACSADASSGSAPASSSSPRSPPGERASSSLSARRSSRSARCSGRSWPRTSSS